MDKIRGMVWQKTIERSELEHYQNDYVIISEKMVAGRPVIHIWSENDPANGFTRVEPNLEDVFFSHIHPTGTTLNPVN
ncbi:MAG TPA: hypothetical protein DDW81_08280 [Cryomorphaceae bacterium]|nr:hypothetical protein [Cryomorphaceae bacterium]